jgi:AmiR/NasT family two-component response regulator
MAEHVPHGDDEPDWIVIAQAEGVLSARDHIGILEAATALRTKAEALGVPIDQFAQDLVRPLRSGSGGDA